MHRRVNGAHPFFAAFEFRFTRRALGVINGESAPNETGCRARIEGRVVFSFQDGTTVVGADSSPARTPFEASYFKDLRYALLIEFVT